MAKIKFKQVKSKIDSTDRQKRTLQALGFTRNNQTVEVEGTPQVIGMYNKVKHLVIIEA